MRLGLLGDIHGNALALAAVLSAAKQAEIEAFCVTGDFVGYYHHASEAIEMLRDVPFQAVRGNHDDMLFAIMNDPEARADCRKKYGSALERALDTLSPGDIDFLRALPRTRTLEFGGRSLLLGHGTPWDTDVYLYPDAPDAIWDKVGTYDADFIVLGHTHYQITRQVAGKLVINPGSVGQPRDRKPGAAWTILDTATGETEHRREPYDIASVAAEAQHNDPDLPYLWTVLTRT